MAEINVKIYEDNAGGIHAVVRKDGMPTNFLSGLEQEYTREAGLTGADLIEAAKGGFEFADDYDPGEFGGKSLEDIVSEVEAEETNTLIAEITQDKATLYYDSMGAEGHYLWGYEA